MKVFGIPVKVEGSFLFVLLMAMGRSYDLSLVLEWAAVVFFSVLVHELGHAFAGQWFGLTPKITLYAMGGLTSWEGGRRELKPYQGVLISLAGPSSGLLLGGLVFLFQPRLSKASLLASIAVSDLLWVNVAWSLFNLLPILPLDGGHVMESVEEWVRGKRENLVSGIVSLTLAALAFVWSIANRYSWIAFLTGWFAWSNASSLLRRFRRRLDRPLQEQLELAAGDLKAEDGKALIARSEEVFQKARSPQLKERALEFVIYGQVLEQDFAEAERRLRQYTALFGANAYLQGYLLYRKGDLEAAIELLKGAFERGGSLRAGEMLFYAFTEAGRFDEAFRLCSHPALERNARQFYLNLQIEAFERRQHELAARIGEKGFETTSDPAIAYNVGCAFARLNDLPKAFEWVLLAVQSGFGQKDLLENDPDLAELRELPEFGRIAQAVVAREPAAD